MFDQEPPAVDVNDVTVSESTTDHQYEDEVAARTQCDSSSVPLYRSASSSPAFQSGK